MDLIDCSEEIKNVDVTMYIILELDDGYWYDHEKWYMFKNVSFTKPYRDEPYIKVVISYKDLLKLSYIYLLVGNGELNRYARKKDFPYEIYYDKQYIPFYSNDWKLVTVKLK